MQTFLPDFRFAFRHSFGESSAGKPAFFRVFTCGHPTLQLAANRRFLLRRRKILRVNARREDAHAVGCARRAGPDLTRGKRAHGDDARGQPEDTPLDRRHVATQHLTRQGA